MENSLKILFCSAYHLQKSVGGLTICKSNYHDRGGFFFYKLLTIVSILVLINIQSVICSKHTLREIRMSYNRFFSICKRTTFIDALGFGYRLRYEKTTPKNK